LRHHFKGLDPFAVQISEKNFEYSNFQTKLYHFIANFVGASPATSPVAHLASHLVATLAARLATHRTKYANAYDAGSFVHFSIELGNYMQILHLQKKL
jgi:hypothetical protein